MKIVYQKKFLKQFDALERRQQITVRTAIDRFRTDPFDPMIRNHPLKGRMKGQRSLSAGFDLRIIFEERDGYTVVIMIAVGRHEDVYE